MDWVFTYISGNVMLLRLQYLPCFVVTADSAMLCHAVLCRAMQAL